MPIFSPFVQGFVRAIKLRTMTYNKAVRTFISKASAARRLGISRPALYRQIKLGLIPTDERGRLPRPAFEAVAAVLNVSSTGDAS